MKVLIGYDGTSIANDSLSELVNAGLPAETKTIVYTVKGGWLSDRTDQEIAEIAAHGRAKLAAIFPTWDVRAHVGHGSPAAQILHLAELSSPDLIVLGERRQSVMDRNMFLGGVANEVLTGATGSVRICRRGRNGGPPLNIIGFDGSEPANKAVEALAARTWPKNAAAMLVVVADSKVIGAIGRLTPQISNSTIESRAAHQWAEALCREPLSLLRRRGLHADFHLEFGNPKDVLATFAEERGASCVFMGPHCSGNSYERFLLGSVSTSLAARAHCSVEIIR
jgi:nucleotide-binding universal stress UspA family protein